MIFWLRVASPPPTLCPCGSTPTPCRSTPTLCRSTPTLCRSTRRGRGRGRGTTLSASSPRASRQTETEKGGPTDDYHGTLRSLNSRGRHVPKKSLGQHYMLNWSVNEELARAADVGEGDVVLEIGPGTGSLTNTLLNAGATVLAVEKDPHMATLLKDRFGCTDRLKIIQEDITKSHISSHLAPFLQTHIPGAPKLKLAKVVANLPFNISTEVVKLLLPMGNTFSTLVLLLQEEAAARLAHASVETPDYRSINIFVNFYSHPEYKLKVERTNFFPQPKFDAAIIKFKLKQISEYPPVVSPKSFFSMVNSAFNGKRKMLRKSLQHLCSSAEIELALDSMGLPITSRPCELTLDEFVTLHNNLVKL